MANQSNTAPSGLASWLLTNKKQLATCAGAAVAAYLAYKAYNSQSAAQLSKVKTTLQQYASLLSSIGSTANLVAGDLHAFLNSDEDELPRSLRQLTKVLQSPEVQATVSTTATSLAQSVSTLISSSTSSSMESSGPMLQTLIDAVLSDRGRSLVGMAVGLATKNATATFCEFLERFMQRQQASAAGPDDQAGPTDPVSTIMALLGSEQGERIMSLLITKSIKTAVSAYVDATTGYNVYEDMVASIAKQEHREAVSDIMSRVTAAFCRELASAYRRATRPGQQQQPQQQRQQHAGGPHGACSNDTAHLGWSSASSSTNSVVSLAGHVQPTNTSGTTQPWKHFAASGLNRRHSCDNMAAGAHAPGTQQVSGAALPPTGSGSGPRQGWSGQPALHLKANAPRMPLVPSSSGQGLAGSSSSCQRCCSPESVEALAGAGGGHDSGGSSSAAWWRPLVDLAKEQHVRSLTLDVVRSATREATRSTWESLFTSSSSALEGAHSWAAGVLGLSRDGSQQQLAQHYALYRMYALMTVCVSLFMYAVSPRVIAI